jgi:vitamin B12 transporter
MRETAIVTAMILAACATHAADTVDTKLPDMVVTPTGHATLVHQPGHSISTITADQIAANRWRSLPEALRSVAGLHIVEAGAPGSTVSTYLRGSRSSHVLVLMDGVRMNDPSGPTRESYLSGMDLNNVERIEILRGPQSGLYGADAVAGVINIITKKAAEGVSSSLTLEAGSYETYRVGAELASRQGTLSGAASVSYLESKGFSSASERFAGNDEADGLERLNVGARVSARPSDSIALDASVNASSWESEYDDGAGPGGDAEGNVAEIEQVLTGLRARFGASDAAWQQTLSAQNSMSDRTFKDSYGTSTFEGENWEAEWRHDIAITDGNKLSVGVGYRDETAETDSIDSVSADNLGVYVQDHICHGAFDAIAGLRYDEHEEFGSELTYRVAPSFALEQTGTRLKGSVGTGFKAPSLYQLYAPAGAFGAVGNAALNPETSLGWDAGVEQSVVPGLLTFGITYFASDVEDLIEYVNGYENVSKVETRGLEVQASLTPTDNVTVDATYTYTDSENKDTGDALIRIPKDRATLAIGYDVTERTRLNANVLYVGGRNDSYYDSQMFSAVDVRNSSYTVVNLAASFDATDTVTVFARVDNLFDESYEEVYGYGTAGVSGYGGVKISL